MGRGLWYRSVRNMQRSSVDASLANYTLRSRNRHGLRSEPLVQQQPVSFRALGVYSVRSSALRLVR